MAHYGQVDLAQAGTLTMAFAFPEPGYREGRTEVLHLTWARAAADRQHRVAVSLENLPKASKHHHLTRLL